MPNAPEDLTGAVLSDLSPETFKKTINRLSGFATFKYGHYMSQAVQNRHTKNFSHLTKLSDDDISHDPDGAKYWW